MRHRKSGRKLGRSASHRDAMMRNMVTSLFDEEKIQTTSARAKELRRVAERLLGVARKHPPSAVAEASDEAEKTRREAARVAAVRQAGRVVRDRFVLQKLFSELAERYQARNGGYTRILKLGRRLGDNAELSIVELVTDHAEMPEEEAVASPEETGEALV